ncbi:MAG TPA: hypothetical protein VJT74_03730 [Pyrinomonadaceae bacterium]|nr:hypothetical protein [Pyrinomonadaceae bacterium]
MRAVVIFVTAVVVAFTSACRLLSDQPGGTAARTVEVGEPSKDYGAPVHLADLEEKGVDESSGVVASRRNPGLFWTHNDSGDGPLVYAFDRQGRRRGVWKVSGAKARDWEDVAAGPGPQRGQSYLYVGDIGDNDKERKEVVVYRVAEPAITDDTVVNNAVEPYETAHAEAIRLKYPDGRHDAEALAVHPATGDLYVITKTRNPTAAAGVYKLAAPYSVESVNTLQKIGEVRVPSLFPGMITGADISPDGSRFILCDYFNAYELVSAAGSTLDEVWKQKPAVVRLGPRPQGEAVCYTLDGQSILATSEGSPAAVIEVPRVKR